LRVRDDNTHQDSHKNKLEVTDELFTAAFDSGPLATFRFSRLCYPYLKENNGSIINVGTAAALRWDPMGYGCYAAVKEAIRSLTRAAACEWGLDGMSGRTVTDRTASVPLKPQPGRETRLFSAQVSIPVTSTVWLA